MADIAGETKLESLDPTSQGPIDVVSNLKPIQSVLQDILVTLQKSSIVNRDVGDTRLRFWNTYKSEADDFDKEFLEKFNSALDNSMLFAGLFCGVSATFVGLLEPNFNADPNLVNQVLLQYIVLRLNSTTPLEVPLVLPTWTGPSSTIVWSQSLLYSSMATSLFTAMCAVLAKQWLNHYSRSGVRGTIEDRGKARQRKLGGLEEWYFHPVLECLPLLLQFSLLLFVVGLSLFLWDQHKTVGVVSILINGGGCLCYILFTLASTFSSDCPFQTPVSVVLKSLLEGSHRSAQQVWAGTQRPLRGPYEAVRAVPSAFSGTFKQARRALFRSFTSGWRRVSRPLQGSLPRTDVQPSVQDVEAPSTSFLPDPQVPHPDPHQHVGRAMTLAWATIAQSISGAASRAQGALTRGSSSSVIPPVPSGDPLAATSVSWILETSDDPTVRSVASEYVVDVNWPPEFNIAPLLDRFLEDLIDCFEPDIVFGTSGMKIIESSQEKALACGKAFLFLYWHGRTISRDHVVAWEPPAEVALNRGVAQRALNSHFGYDELAYISWLIEETLLAHPNKPLGAGHTMRPRPVPSQPSASTAAALSSIWLHMLEDPRSFSDMSSAYTSTIVNHALSMSIYVPIVPAVIERYHSTLVKALGRMREGRAGSIPKFDTEAVLSRTREMRSVMPKLIASGDFFLSPLGRYVSGFAYVLSCSVRASPQLRQELKKEGVPRWCLNQCKSMYLAHRVHYGEGDRPAPLDLWASLMLRLALSVMDNDDEESEKDPTSGPLFSMLLGKASSLDANDQKTVFSHLSWISQSTVALLGAYQNRTRYSPVFVDDTSFNLKLDLMASSLLSVSATVEAVETDAGLAKAYTELMSVITHSLIALRGKHNIAYRAGVWSVRGLFDRAIRQEMSQEPQPSDKATGKGKSKGEEVLGKTAMSPVYDALLSFLAREADKENEFGTGGDGTVVADVARALADTVPGRGMMTEPSLPQAINPDNRIPWLELFTFTHQPHPDYGHINEPDQGNNDSWYHTPPTLNSLSRIALRSVNFLQSFSPGFASLGSLPTSPPDVQRAALAVACMAASGVSVGIAGRARTSEVGWSLVAAHQTIAILEGASGWVAREMENCIREIVRRGSSFRIVDDNHPAGLDEEIYAAFRKKVDWLDSNGDQLDSSQTPIYAIIESGSELEPASEPASEPESEPATLFAQGSNLSQVQQAPSLLRPSPRRLVKSRRKRQKGDSSGGKGS